MKILYHLLLLLNFIYHIYSFNQESQFFNEKSIERLPNVTTPDSNKFSRQSQNNKDLKEQNEKMTIIDKESDDTKTLNEQLNENSHEVLNKQSIKPNSSLIESSKKRIPDSVYNDFIELKTKKYNMINDKQFSDLCSNQLLKKTPVQTLHRTGNDLILILDEYKLAFKFTIDAAKKFFPKVMKLPYRCTSYCEKMSTKMLSSDKYPIKRYKYNKYLIEFLTMKDNLFVKFFIEEPKHMKDKDQSNHLIDVLTFTIENDGCTSPIPNPQLNDDQVDNLVTRNLISIFCNEQLRELFRNNYEFLIQERHDYNSINKIRHLIFFTYPIVEAYNLTGKISRDTKLQKNNLANSINNIRNAVQIVADKRVMFLTFNNDSMHIMQKQETQLVNRPPSYSLQNFYSCPEPLCLDPYFDDLFIIKYCDFDLLFDFLPRTSRLLLAFRGNYFYLIDKDRLNAPQIENAIPIDYLFNEILKKPEIDFKYIDAGEYVKKSDIMILFKDDEYILIDPLHKIVNGPFKTANTFKSSKRNIDTVFMNGNDLIMICGEMILKYSWSAPSLTGRHDISLNEYINLLEIIKLKEDLKIDAAFQDDNSYYLFIDDEFIKMEAGVIDDEKFAFKKTSKNFFKNCGESTKTSKLEKDWHKMISNLKLIYKSIINTEDKIIGRAIFRNESNDNSTMIRSKVTQKSNSEFHFSKKLHLLIIALVSFNLLINF